MSTDGAPEGEQTLEYNLVRAQLHGLVESLRKPLNELPAPFTPAAPNPTPRAADLSDLIVEVHRLIRLRTRALLALETEIRQANAELRALNQTKSEFIAIAAHELRTPLTSIIGYLDLLEKGRFGVPPKPMERPLASVKRNSGRLMRLVEELLIASHLEGGRVTLHRQNQDVCSLIAHVVDSIAPLANDRQQVLTAELPAESLWAEIDGDKIDQIITNLIHNAIRYSGQSSHITVTVDHAPADTHPGDWIRIRVRDNGPGIPAEVRSRIFEPFVSWGKPMHHTSAGPGSSGLGLYITRELVDLHGGVISVDSELGRFCEFTVLLPQHAQMNAQKEGDDVL